MIWWPKEKGQRDKQWYINNYTKNYRFNNTNPLKTGRIKGSCLTCGTCRVTVKRHEQYQYAQINTNNIYKTWTPDKTEGSKDESNNVFLLRGNRSVHHNMELREQSIFIRWRGWTILGGSNLFLYRYCGGQFLKPLSLGAVNLSLKHLVVKKK